MFNTFSRAQTVALAAVVVAAGMAAAAPARAALEIQLQSGGQTFNEIGGNPLTVQHSIGNFSTSLDFGLASDTPELDLSSANLSTSAAGSLVITLSENNLTSPLGAANWLTQFSGNFFSSSSPVNVTLQTYLDASNTLLGTGTALSTLSSSSSPFALSAAASARMSAPYAITEVLTVTAQGASVTSLDASVTAVPEPASLALMGSALFGIGLVRRRAPRRAA